MRYSRQRETILEYLHQDQTHPTAETIHQEIQKLDPHISLGTVYRNLTQLAELGEIQKIPTDTGPDRFDWNPEPHYHFFCTECKAVLDLNMAPLDHINLLAEHDFGGIVKGHTARFYGTCPSCMKKTDETKISSS